MGRAPCCSKIGLRRGAWIAREDAVLKKYVETHGEGRWRSVPKRAGLLRCGKSCRLRWLNYLRPSIKRGNIEPEEGEIIIKLHALLGNRWALIAKRLPGRTDNEIKNYWNTHLSKLLKTRGIDPRTHKQLPLDGESPNSSPQDCNKLGSRKRQSEDSNLIGATKICLPKANRFRPLPLMSTFGSDLNLLGPQTQSQEKEANADCTVKNEYTNVGVASSDALAGDEKMENFPSVRPLFSWKEWEESLDFLTVNEDINIGIGSVNQPFSVEDVLSSSPVNESFSWIDCADERVGSSRDDVLQKVYKEFVDLVSFDGSRNAEGSSINYCTLEEQEQYGDLFPLFSDDDKYIQGIKDF